MSERTQGLEPGSGDLVSGSSFLIDVVWCLVSHSFISLDSISSLIKGMLVAMALPNFSDKSILA